MYVTFEHVKAAIEIVIILIVLIVAVLFFGSIHF